MFPPETDEWEEYEDLDAMLPNLPSMLYEDLGPSAILSLPNEILVHIASLLSKAQLGALRLSCKAFCRAGDNHMMRSLSLSRSSMNVHSKVSNSYHVL